MVNGEKITFRVGFQPLYQYLKNPVKCTKAKYCLVLPDRGTCYANCFV